MQSFTMILLFLTILLSPLVVGQNEVCPQGWQKVPGFGCLFFGEDLVRHWDASFAFCRDLGGSLVRTHDGNGHICNFLHASKTG